MKYSILFPYYSRPEIKYALDSFKKLYQRTDYEIIIIEDTKNIGVLHDELLSIVKNFNMQIKIIQDTKVSYNSASKYNVGAAHATGEILILSNPETIHMGDVLGSLDEHAHFPGFYYIFDCASLDKNLDFLQWYQHRTINRMYHFCSAIAKQDFPGFNEDFCNGIAYEDDSFISRIKQLGFLIHTIEDPIVGHVDHPRDYSLDPIEKQRLVSINEKLWRKCIETGRY